MSIRPPIFVPFEEILNPTPNDLYAAQFHPGTPQTHGPRPGQSFQRGSLYGEGVPGPERGTAGPEPSYDAGGSRQNSCSHQRGNFMCLCLVHPDPIFAQTCLVVL